MKHTDSAHRSAFSFPWITRTSALGACVLLTVAGGPKPENQGPSSDVVFAAPLPAEPDVDPPDEPPVPARPPRPPLTVRKGMGQAREAAEQARIAAKEAMDSLGESFGAGLERLNWQIDNVLARKGNSGRVLFVPSGDTDPQKLKEADEDLNIMSRLLVKAVTKKGSDESEGAMGIKLWSADRSRNIRHLHFEGQGALFLFRVDFPLVPPPEWNEADAGKAPKSNPWDDTKHELYGRGRGKESRGDVMVYRDGGEPAESYDSHKVEVLQNELLENLKHGTNMRHLRPEESVTVMVLGPTGERGARMVRRQIDKSNAPGGLPDKFDTVVSISEDSETNRGTTLYLRAKKADIDAFAKGTLDLAGFRKRVKVMTY